MTGVAADALSFVTSSRSYSPGYTFRPRVLDCPMPKREAGLAGWGGGISNLCISISDLLNFIPHLNRI